MVETVNIRNPSIISKTIRKLAIMKEEEPPSMKTASPLPIIEVRGPLSFSFINQSKSFFFRKQSSLEREHSSRIFLYRSKPMMLVVANSVGLFFLVGPLLQCINGPMRSFLKGSMQMASISIIGIFPGKKPSQEVSK